MTTNLKNATLRAIARRKFCTLATSSSSHRPHVAGVLSEAVDTTLYVSTLRASRKARNIADNPHVCVCIPVRRLPVGPPSSVQFQGVADIFGTDDVELRRLVASGRLKSITGHGELELRGGCFLRIRPARRLNTYGLGMSVMSLLRDPLNASDTVELVA